MGYCNIVYAYLSKVSNNELGADFPRWAEVATHVMRGFDLFAVAEYDTVGVGLAVPVRCKEVMAGMYADVHHPTHCQQRKCPELTLRPHEMPKIITNHLRLAAYRLSKFHTKEHVTVLSQCATVVEYA